MGATADCGYRAAPFERQLCEVRYWRRKSSDFKPKTVNEKFAGADEAVPAGSTRISVIDPKPVTPSGRTFERRITQKPQRTCSMACARPSTKNTNNATQVSPDLHLFFFIAKFSLAIFLYSRFPVPPLRLSTINYQLLYSAFRI